MSTEKIKVIVRFRPLQQKESSIKEMFSLRLTETTVEISYAEQKHCFIFDQVFHPTANQEILFKEKIKTAVEWVAEGYNSTIIAYGPTFSGKTYTMFGSHIERGIIPRSCDLLFNLLQTNTNIIELGIKCSFLEIYRENIRDLLNIKKIGGSLRLRQHADQGVYVQNLTEKYVNNTNEILQIINNGLQFRATASTALNDFSSRSHAIFTITVRQVLSDSSNLISKLNFVDLAGSENVNRSEVSGVELLETQMINKSLSSIGNVIYALTDKNRSHIPYRDAKLTYLLQDSLGGNSRTILIATASPYHSCYSETVNTLKFAKRAKEIKNQPKINRNESNLNLLNTVELLNKKLASLEEKYNHVCAILDQTKKKDEEKFIFNILKDRIDNLEQKLSAKEKDLLYAQQKYSKLEEFLERQRELTQTAIEQLFKNEVLKSNAIFI
jgi:kinesin family member 5